MKIKKTVTMMLAIMTILLVFTSCSGRKDALAVATQMIEDTKGDKPFTYSHTIKSGNVEEKTVYSQDVNGNVELYKEQDNNTYTFYKIGDEYSVEASGPFYTLQGPLTESELDSEKISKIISGHNSSVRSKLEYAMLDTLDEKYGNAVQSKGDNYEVKGSYTNGNGYALEMAKDGSSMNYKDAETKISIDFNYTDTIEAPKK